MQAFRKIVKGWLGKVLLGIITLIFGAVGIQALTSIVSRPKPAIKINHEDISQQALDRIITIQKQSLLARMGEHADPKWIDSPAVRQRITDSLIERTLLKQQAEERGLAIKEEMIKKSIMAMPQFQKNGQFSEESFKALVHEYGFTPAQFLKELAVDGEINQWHDGLGLSAFVTTSELKQLLDLEKQSRKVAYFSLPVSRYQAEIKITPEQMTAYYEKHKKDFLTEEQAQFNFIQLTVSDYEKKVSVTESELATEYEKQKHSALSADKEQRRAAHILLTVDPKNPKAAVDQLMAIRAKILKGESFAQLAKQYSKDPGSAANGGELGFAGRGVFEPSFEASLFSLKKPGDLSGIVKTSFGVHLIQLEEIKKPTFASFISMKEALKKQLLTRKAEALYQDAVSQLQEKAFEAGDLVALAKEFSVPVRNSAWINRSGAAGWNNLASDGKIFLNKKVLSAAFSQSVLEEQHNSDVIELDSQHSVVVRLGAHNPAAVKPQVEVAHLIQERILHDQSLLQTKAIGQEIIKKLRGGAMQAAIASQYGVHWVQPAPLLRTSTELNYPLIQKIFGLPKPKKANDVVYDGMMSGDTDFYVIALLSVTEGQEALKPQDVHQSQGFLATQQAQRDFNYFVKYIKSQADIEIKQ